MFLSNTNNKQIKTESSSFQDDVDSVNKMENGIEVLNTLIKVLLVKDELTLVASFWEFCSNPVSLSTNSSCYYTTLIVEDN